MKKHDPIQSILTLLILLVLFISSVVVVSPVVSAGTIVVTTFVDEVENNGFCSLREAIIAANWGQAFNDCKTATAGANTIILSEGTYTLSLVQQLEPINSDITILGDLSIIEASDCNPITLPGNCPPANHRIMSVTQNGQLTLEGITLRHGNADYGGAIANLGTLTIVKSTLTANRAEYGGGGIFINDPASSLLLDDVTITGNATDYIGGGIYSANCDTVTVIAQSKIKGNSAGLGGGIYNSDYCEVHIHDSEIYENFSDLGGSGINNKGNMFLTGSAITENKTDGDGGGFRNEPSGVVTIDTTEIIVNEADEHGGGIFNMGSLILTDSNLTRNTAFEFGGGIYTRGSLDMTGGVIGENNAEWNGGGMYITGEFSVEPVHTNMTDVILLDNDAKTGRGGGVYNHTHSELNLVSCTVEGNTAFIDGGGIHNTSELNISLNSYIYDNHTQTGNGGGIYTGGVVTVDESELDSNTAKVGSGGGIFNTGILTIEKSFIRSNLADMGGGIYHLGLLNMDGSTIIDNTAENAGGGIYNGATDHYRGNVELLNSYIIENEAIAGGGVYNQGIFTMQGGALSENTAGGEGGGIFNNAELSVSIPTGIVDLINTTLTANLAQSGGGIINRGQLWQRGTTLSGNTAEVTHGGGVLNTEGGESSFTNSTFSGNSAEEHGGGIANFGSLFISHCTIYENDAESDGGGLYNSGAESDLVIRNSIIAGSKNYDCYNSSGTVSINFQNLIVENPDKPYFCKTPLWPIVASDPMLGSLADNGGPTLTHALLEGSPAIDAISPDTDTCTDFDQRGIRRPQGAGCDVGAFELEQGAFIFLPLILR